MFKKFFVISKPASLICVADELNDENVGYNESLSLGAALQAYKTMRAV